MTKTVPTKEGKMSAQVNTNSALFKWKQRLGLGGIEFGRDLVQYMADVYLSVYLTTVAQLPLPAISLMFLLCKFIDAATDVIIGALVDKTNTKIGRARPWIYAGAVVYLFGIYAVFHSPNFGPTGKVVYMYLAYILYTLGMTMVNIPEGALMAALTTEARERTAIGASRNVASTLANTIIGSVVLPLVAFFGKGVDLVGYARTALLMGSLMMIIVFISNTIAIEVAKPVMAKKESKSLGETLKLLFSFFTCKNFNCEMILCFGNLLFAVSVASTMAYYCMFVLDHRTDIMGLGFTALSICNFITSFIAPELNLKFSKRMLSISGAVIAILGIALRYLSPSVPMILPVGMGIIGFGQGLIGCMIQTTQPDIVDELAVRDGEHNSGLALSMFSLSCQVAVGVCNALVAAILNMGGFAGDAAVQSASAIRSINIVFGVLPIAALILIVIGMSFYDLDSKYAEIQEKLKVMRGEE